MIMTKTALSIFLVALGILWVGSTTTAKPSQALGLVALVEPIPMKCENGVCDTVVSAFCLQKYRRSPFSTDLYREPKRRDIRIVARTFAGLEVTLPSDAFAFPPDP